MTDINLEVVRRSAAMAKQSERPKILHAQLEQLRAEKNPKNRGEIEAIKNELAALAAAGYR
ncbi:hypothetical protein [Methylotuvimicrobium sp. KM1]|uniref:hypothetical protein n=1 Tax=unclassified Methylotuvimicrobium TaxID=2822412 RepID=UPI0038516B76